LVARALPGSVAQASAEFLKGQADNLNRAVAAFKV